MTVLVYADPETGERRELDLTGWRFVVELGGATLADRDLVVHLLQASLELEVDGTAPMAVSFVDGTPCVVAYRKRPATGELP